MKNLDEITTRQQKSITTRKNILNAARQVINHQGSENFNIKNICEEADISVGGFYHHFKSIEVLVCEIYNIDDSVFNRLETEPLIGSAREQVLQIFRFQIEYITSLGLDLLMQYYKGIFAHLKEDTNRYYQEFYALVKLVEDCLRSGQKKGEVPPEIDCADTAKLLMTMSRGFIFSWCSLNGNTDLMRVVQTSIRVYLDSINCK